MIQIAAWVLVYCVAASASIVLLGDRALLSGDISSLRGVIALLVSWKFILAMALALVARLAFTMVNRGLLAVPEFAPSATSITAFVTAISYVAIVAASAVFLGERLTLQQGAGALLVVAGIAVLSA